MRAEVLLIVSICTVSLAAPSCRKSGAAAAGHSANDVSKSSKSSLSARKNKALRSHEVYASWYSVPWDSLARRRAGAAELTAAYDRLPLGSVLRVTRISTGKSVLVRITDRGVRAHRGQIDI